MHYKYVQMEHGEKNCGSIQFHIPAHGSDTIIFSAETTHLYRGPEVHIRRRNI